MGLATTATPSTAAPTIIYGTGQGSSIGGRDSHWQVVAFPASFTPPSSQTSPYSAYVVQGVCGAWIDCNGYTDPTTSITNYWVSPNTNNGSISPGNYNWILKQDFNVATAGNYAFNFLGTADNQMNFFIDGTVAGIGTQLPTITGGTQIGTGWNNFGQFKTFTGSTYLTAGTHSAYMVLNDFGGNTGAIIQQSFFETAVPGPTPLLGAATAFAASRRLRKRIRLSRSAAGVQAS